MIPVASDNRPLNVLPMPPAIGQLEVPLPIRMLIAPFEPAAKWVWDVIVLRTKEDGAALALLFSSALGIFPFWVTIALAVSGIVLISLSISNAQAKSNRLEADNRELNLENQALEAQNQLLVDQRGDLQIRYDAVSQERNDLIQERERFSIERGDLIGSRLQITREKDRLAEEIHRLKQQENGNQEKFEQLIQQKGIVEAEKKRLEEQFRNILGELGKLRAQAGRVDGYRKLQENLERFHDLYQQVVGGQEDRGGALQYAQEKLIPLFKAHRAELHEMLKTAIGRLKDDDLSRVPLMGILSLSEEEMEHLEQISETILLLRELREPLARQFQQNINKPAGEI